MEVFVAYLRYFTVETNLIITLILVFKKVPYHLWNHMNTEKIMKFISYLEVYELVVV